MLDIPLDAVLGRIFVTHSFSFFRDLKLDNTITMAPIKVSFELVFVSFQKKLTINNGKMVFGF